jgi:3-mercaptopyruvate sulfurtransferase SseA
VPKAMCDPAFREGPDERQELVSTEWLAERLGRPDIALVDASVGKGLGNDGAWLSDRAAFEAGHIPGARFADLVSDFSDPEERFAFTRPTAARLASAAGAIGLTIAPAYGPRDCGGSSRPSVTTRYRFWTAA